MGQAEENILTERSSDSVSHGQPTAHFEPVCVISTRNDTGFSISDRLVLGQAGSENLEYQLGTIEEPLTAVGRMKRETVVNALHGGRMDGGQWVAGLAAFNRASFSHWTFTQPNFL